LHYSRVSTFLQELREELLKLASEKNSRNSWTEKNAAPHQSKSCDAASPRATVKSNTNDQQI